LLLQMYKPQVSACSAVKYVPLTCSYLMARMLVLCNSSHRDFIDQ
jgi:hypothetical protein